MRIACVHLPHFYIQVERLKNPEIEGSQVIIGGTPNERSSVADCSEEAAAQGIHLGMAVREAYYLCPDALFLPFDGQYERIWADILFALGAFALRIESERPGLAYLDITKASQIYKGERAMAAAIIREMLVSSGLKAHIGVGNSRFIAKEAAFCAWDTLVIEPGGEKAFLSLLSIESLPLEEKEKNHLRLLGLSTLKKLAALSRKALISQFGLKAGTLWETINGVDEKRPIPRRRDTISLEREFTGETPLEASRELRPIMGTMVAELSVELNRMHMVCRKIEVMLSLQDGRLLERILVMKKPTAEVQSILVRLFDFLEYLTLESPIVSFRLSIPDPAPLEGDQEDLFRRRSVFAERLDGIKAYLDARYGYTPLMRIEEREGASRLPERKFRFTDV
jgi:nucleotidyltransferase/DNA polymerase involved in DNA repair